MNAPVNRVFIDAPAIRQATPLLFGIVGPSSSGKTYSALRIATGIQRVSGGEIYTLDTESNRALAYAEKFKFRHVPFSAPFSPLDYLAAVEHCVAKGAKVIIVDSMSHEHEGPGGVLEEHDAEMERLSKLWRVPESKTTIAAWSAPKAKRRRLINSLLQINCNFVFCFRAKEKLKIVSGKDPLHLGFMPIAGEEFIYEMTGNALLLPGAKGVPEWEPMEVGERAMVKMPEQFEEMFKGERRQLDEDVGQKMAQWAAGVKPIAQKDIDTLVTSYALVADKAMFGKLEIARNEMWNQLGREQKLNIKAARDACAEKVGS